MAYERELAPPQTAPADQGSVDERWPVPHAILFVTAASIALWSLIIVSRQLADRLIGKRRKFRIPGEWCGGGKAEPCALRWRANLARAVQRASLSSIVPFCSTN